MPDVRLSAASAPVRRALTPSAWIVLEELVMTADRTGAASTNARALAVALGMSKDTAARAVQRLIAGGLVQRVEHRSLDTGQFAPIAYRVDLLAAGLEVEQDRAPVEPSSEPSGNDDRPATQRAVTHRIASRSARRQIEHTPTNGDQLELFRG